MYSSHVVTVRTYNIGLTRVRTAFFITRTVIFEQTILIDIYNITPCSPVVTVGTNYIIELMFQLAFITSPVK